MNMALMVGTANRDAELKFLPSGTAQCGFTITIAHSYTNKAGEQKHVKHVQPVVMWGKNAETISEQVRQGCLVSVKGRLQTKQWVDQKNERHSVTEVVADMFDGVTVLSGASGQANAKPASQRESAQVSPATSDADNAEKGAEDEVPF